MASKVLPSYSYKYKILNHIQEGSYSHVYKAESLSNPDVPVALKVAKKNQIKALFEEIIILSRCKTCPEIIPMLDGGAGYLVMKYFPTDLCEYIYNTDFEPLPLRLIESYTLQLLAAVKFLHDNGIVHADIKPENILLDCEGNLALCDFSLSYIVGEELGDEEAYREVRPKYVCTPFYRPPELLSSPNNWPIKISAERLKACDMWTVGVVLLVMLTGKPPFGESMLETDTIRSIKSTLGWDNGTKRDEKWWDKVTNVLSEDGKKFLEGLLDFSVEKRIKAGEALDSVRNGALKRQKK